MSGRIFTLGYQGASADAFVARLREAGVATLIDVRAVAWSRRPEFAKRALAERLAAAGIAYIHIPALGNPPAGREAGRAGDRDGFRRHFAAHLAGPPAQAALAELAARAAREAVCLTCLEADPADCHRAQVADALAAGWGFAVVHLRAAPPDGPAAARQPTLL